jgi:hypothetical protein
LAVKPSSGSLASRLPPGRHTSPVGLARACVRAGSRWWLGVLYTATRNATHAARIVAVHTHTTHTLVAAEVGCALGEPHAHAAVLALKQRY